MPSHEPTAPSDAGLPRALRRLLSSIRTISGRKAYIAVFLMFLSSLAEGIGIAVVLPALQLAGIEIFNQGSTHRYIALMIDLLSKLGLGTQLPLATVLALLALIVIMRTAFLNLESVYVAETVYQFVMRMDLRVYQSVVGADWGVILRHRSSEFMNLLTTEHERLALATREFLLLVAGILSASLYIGLAFLISVRLTLLFAGCAVLLAVALRHKTERVHRAATQASVEIMKLSGEALEHLQNLKAVKAYAAQNRDIAMFSRSIMNASDAMIETQRNAAAASFWWEGGSLMMMLAILYFALTLHSSSPATAFLLLAVFARIVPKLSALNDCVQSVVANLPAHTRMETAISELTAAAESIPPPKLRLSLNRALAFESVSFRFHPHGRKILDEISLTIPAGEIVAIVGSSGAGKSTLADIAMGLLNADSGRVMLDETELSPSLIQAWRANIGYVAQDTVLFHDTIRANLLWAKPDATETEMREALSLTAAEFVMEFTNGLETVVGERGALLSHGERQRLALTRAMLRKPSMLILDEPTNNLDSENERRVMESVVNLRNSVTILIIAHRLSTLRFADTIYVLEGGKIVEQGNWDVLMNRVGGRFRELYEGQREPFPSCS